MDKDVVAEVLRFRKERGWSGACPRDIAISVSLEASELLEHFQWSDWRESLAERREDIGDELADVLIYCMALAEEMDFDLASIIRGKLVKNAVKYPAPAGGGTR